MAFEVDVIVDVSANITAIREAVAVRRYRRSFMQASRLPEMIAEPESNFGAGNTLELSFEQQIRFEGAPRPETAW